MREWERESGRARGRESRGDRVGERMCGSVKTRERERERWRDSGWERERERESGGEKLW